MVTGLRNKYGRTAGTALTVVLAASLLGACGDNGTTQPDPNYTDTTSTQSNAGMERSDPGDTGNSAANGGAAGDSEAGGTDTNAAVPGGSANAGEDDQATGTQLMHDGTGTYTGQQDTHTVEIETANGPMSFQIDDNTALSLEGLNPNDKVTFQYKEKEFQTDDGSEKQLWLTKIEKSQ